MRGSLIMYPLSRSYCAIPKENQYGIQDICWSGYQSASRVGGKLSVGFYLITDFQRLIAGR